MLQSWNPNKQTIGHVMCRQLTRKLTIDPTFLPCLEEENDELFANRIFKFNITKLLRFIQNNPDDFSLEEIALEEFKTYSTLTESHIDAVDLSRPVILAEISPGRYNLIDGNHRVEKARITGAKSLLAYKLSVHQHINFLTSEKAYLAYVEYWNSKLK
jgi:hypothetical protein